MSGGRVPGKPFDPGEVEPVGKNKQKPQQSMQEKFGGLLPHGEVIDAIKDYCERININVVEKSGSINIDDKNIRREVKEKREYHKIKVLQALDTYNFNPDGANFKKLCEAGAQYKKWDKGMGKTKTEGLIEKVLLSKGGTLQDFRDKIDEIKKAKPQDKEEHDQSSRPRLRR